MAYLRDSGIHERTVGMHETNTQRRSLLRFFLQKVIFHPGLASCPCRASGNAGEKISESAFHNKRIVVQTARFKCGGHLLLVLAGVAGALLTRLDYAEGSGDSGAGLR